MNDVKWAIFMLVQLAVSGLGFIVLVAIIDAPWFICLWSGIIFVIALLNILSKIAELQEQTDKDNNLPK